MMYAQIENRSMTLNYKNMRYLLIILLLFSCTKERSTVNTCDCLTKNIYRKVVYIQQQVAEDQYFFDTQQYLDFNSFYGQPSPNIYDFDGNGIVGMSDFQAMLSGYGYSLEDSLLCDMEILFPNSHAWNCTYPDAWGCFLHITPIDESSMTFDACPLNSYYVEVIYLDSVVRYYYK